ncbi:MAG: 3-deoxy-D-manno-octulosonic acid kinase, partial [Gammaproteobacteria bacterium]|nr:3-deoxy-D-manno-octulosonic acid kinase [Gammaproteobacteria bacterium]
LCQWLATYAKTFSQGCWGYSGKPMYRCEQPLDHGYILYDKDVIASAADVSFDPKALANSGALVGEVRGRGVNYFIRMAGHDWVLRHYRRGGAIARIMGDAYLWTGRHRTRPWREWRMLEGLWIAGLPVPRPVAARVLRYGLVYRADIIVERLVGALALSQWLRQRRLDKGAWKAIGRCIRRFHDAGVYHPDLNAHNIMLAGEQGIYVIDFDRSELRPPSEHWCPKNLARLRRSLTKVRSLTDTYYFSDQDWQALCEGYG